MNSAIIGIIILFAAYTLNRFVMTNATKKLDDSMKLRIFEVFSKKNNYATVFLLVLVGLYFGAIQFLPQQIFLVTIIYLIVFVTYLILRFIFNYKKLRQLEMPSEYIKSFMVSYGIFTVGFLGMIVCLFWY